MGENSKLLIMKNTVLTLKPFMLFIILIRFDQGEGNPFRQVRDFRLGLRDYLLESDSVSGLPIVDLPGANGGLVCDTQSGQTLLDIVITDVTCICYVFETPNYDCGSYPNSAGGTYSCTYDIQLPTNAVHGTFSLLANEFGIENSPLCQDDSLTIQDIDTSTPIADDSGTFPSAYKLCGPLSQDYQFTLTPTQNRFRLTFQANGEINALGARGLLCFQ